MATPAQIQANRLNALKSTGPRSAEGKAASRFNALKHGMDAESRVIPGEDLDALTALTAEYYSQFRPEGPVERYYVDTIINSDWLRRRLRRCEAQLYNTLVEGEDSDNPLGTAWQHDSAGPNALQKVFRQISALERNFARALAELRRLQAERQPQPAEDGIDVEGHALTRMQASALPQPAANAAPSSQIGFVPPPAAPAHCGAPQGTVSKCGMEPRRSEPRQARQEPITPAQYAV